MAPNEMTVTSTFSLTVETVAILSDLAQRTGKNKSELIRDAIRLLAAQEQPALAE